MRQRQRLAGLQREVAELDRGLRLLGNGRVQTLGQRLAAEHDDQGIGTHTGEPIELSGLNLEVHNDQKLIKT